MTKAKQAEENFNAGLNCSQAVLAACCEDWLPRETALRLSAGLGAGMGKLGRTCGAVSAAYLLLGLKYGAAGGGKQAKENMYALIREFSRRFEARNRSTQCRELLGVDLLEDGNSAAAAQAKAVCPKLVHDAAEIVEEMLG